MIKKTIPIFLILLILFIAMAPLAFATTEEETTSRNNNYHDSNQQISAYCSFPEPPAIYDTSYFAYINPFWILDDHDLNYIPTYAEQAYHTYFAQLIFPPGFQEYYEQGNCDVWLDMRHIPSTANNDRIGIYINIMLAQDFAGMPVYLLGWDGTGNLMVHKTFTINSSGNLRQWLYTPVKSSIRIWQKGFVSFRYDDTVIANPQGGEFTPVPVSQTGIYFGNDYVYSYYLNYIAKDLYSLYNISDFYFRIYNEHLQGINMDLTRIYRILQEFGLSPDIASELPSADHEVDTEVDEAHSREEELLSNQDDVISDIDMIAQQVEDFALGDFRGGSDAINHIYNLFIQSNWVPSIAVLLSLFFGLAILILGRSIK